MNDSNLAILIAVAFERADELDKFLQSLEESDICDIPRVVIINTDPSKGISGQKVVEIARKYQRTCDRVVVSSLNRYGTSMRYGLKKYTGGYKYTIATDPDIWFERRLQFRHCFDYLNGHSKVAAITPLARYSTQDVNERRYTPSVFKYIEEDGFLLVSRQVPLHLCTAQTEFFLDCIEVSQYEYVDSVVWDHCRRIGKKILVMDCRDYAVHFDYHFTKKKYPEYIQFTGKEKFFNVFKIPIEESCYKEI